MTRKALLVIVSLLSLAGCRKKAEPAAPPASGAAVAAPVPGDAGPPSAADGGTATADAPRASAAAADAAAADAAEPAARREYLLERVGDFTVLRGYPDGFAALPLPQRILAWHLWRAAVAGDPIFYDQHYRHNLAIKELLETLVRHPEGIDRAVLDQLTTYLKLVWINHGIHDTMNGDKMPPPFTHDELLAAVQAVAAAGTAVLGTTDPAALAAKLEELRGPLFDPAVDPFATRRTVPDGLDLLTASSNNFYRGGVTMADLAGFTEHYPLDSTLARQDGKLVELVWRAGAEGVAPGLYAPELRAVVRHVRDAMAAASDTQRAVLGKLAGYFETGEPQAFRDYNIAWVADAPPVDAILGFIEVYADPRNQKGAWEGVVFYPDAAGSAKIHELARNAPYFEQQLPYAPEYKRTEFHTPVANRVVALALTGDAGPVGPAGINLPNEQAIRQQYGSKSIDIANLGEARDAVVGAVELREFAHDDAERERGERCAAYLRPEIIGFHEVIGHGSGKVAATLTGDPADHLPGYYNTIEEARADLVALYLAFDPKTVELGVLPSADCAVAVGESYLRGGLLVLRRLPPGGIVEEDHWRATMLIVHYAIARGAARVDTQDGKLYLVMTDPDQWRTTVGELLAELMRIKATGDLAAARTLVETYGAHYDEAWRDDVMPRVEAVGYPKKYAFVTPLLHAVVAADGTITDVTAEPAPSLADVEEEWDRLEAEDAARP